MLEHWRPRAAASANQAKKVIAPLRGSVSASSGGALFGRLGVRFTFWGP
jgi:hypothetical protein